ncbi:division/cell wall cluster transcriptional repressor MraZ [Litorilinea aerophila]|uniref:Transcriptional regulator MraZ n=1 Tax=Litorilinea aerophila TaxID=1204385 RepID=A0A540VGI6_9CHLR|nr:division/cell wall cluster transcriptional repressor MraZ [Litorilinea aerophila]MCC9076543.1 division/cell wall cluster transcriptional repressor MraZ [Litorilinea aerophila]OUC09603.1 cell division protein MraZ [Litorilinea aerophila]
MFLGEFIHSLDSKGRLTIPAKFRDQLAAGLVITRNPVERCLLVIPQARWMEMAEKISALPLTDPRSALLRRAIFSAAEDLKPDRQGRILISQRLRDYAQIESDILVAGLHTFVELWQPSLWEEKVLQPLDSGNIDGELFAALNV